MRAHSKYRDEFTSFLERDECAKAATANVPACNTQNLSVALGLHPDERDVEEVDEEME